MLVAEHIAVTISGARLLRDIGIVVRPGYVTALMGPNGAGKSTLLRVIAGDLAPDSGQVDMDGVPLVHLSIRERARRRAVVSQRASVAFGFTALETVLFGRFPHGGSGARAEDVAIARKALARAGVAELEARLAPTLSGGEFARVMLARALAQIHGSEAPRYLLLDEPTANLDPAHQHHAMRLVYDVARGENVGALVILHDLNLAAQYADEVVLMRRGEIVAAGTPTATFTRAALAATFDVETSVLAHPTAARPLVVVHG
ncbi:MAG: heme ABC transporter ATP-binding protein [Casimicrobiaceae bacterium]